MEISSGKTGHIFFVDLRKELISLTYRVSYIQQYTVKKIAANMFDIFSQVISSLWKDEKDTTIRSDKGRGHHCKTEWNRFEPRETNNLKKKG